MLLAEEIQIIYEISMEIGTSLDLNRMLRNSLFSILRKLNCFIGVILAINSEKNYINFKEIYSIPRNPHNNKTYQKALKKIPIILEKTRKNEFYKNLPIIGKNDDNNFFHIMNLPDFGLIVLIKNNEELRTEIIKSLEPIYLKLANACKACIFQEELKESEKRYREAFKRAELYKDLFVHDISNILQSIQGFLYIISTLNKDFEKINELNKLYELTKDQIIRGSKLISNIHALSQISETEMLVGPVDVISALEKSNEFIYKSFPDKDINIEILSEVNVLFIQANKLLEQAFENVLFNAVRYNEHSKIEIKINVSKQVKNNDKYIKLEFRDNGIGIPDIVKEQIFKSRIIKNERVHGMGLGLLLVKRFINCLNGEIWVEDRINGVPSEGCNFIILLPEVINKKNILKI